MTTLDFSSLTDDQLVDLIRAALQEAVARGGAVEAAVRAAGLDEAEKARIAKDAAEQAARQIREEEAARIAREAAERTRREAESRKTNDAAARLRAIAVEARSLFGSDQDNFKVEVWDRAGDRRVYIGHGHSENWIEYYHTGNHRFGPQTLKITAKSCASDLAKHLEITKEEAAEKIKAFCCMVATKYQTMRLEVTPDNAPLDPLATLKRFILVRAGGFGVYGHKNRGSARNITNEYLDADRFLTADAARAAIPQYVGSPLHLYLAEAPEAIEVREVDHRVAFAPKAEVTS
jgi:hypothetical protein